MLFKKNMAWISKNNKEYKIILLDTNALSEIVEDRLNAGQGFIKKFPPELYAPAFTIYNLIELRRKKDLFKKFMSFFSTYPCFLLKTQGMILDAEINNYYSSQKVNILFNAFSFWGKDESYDLRIFVNKLFSNNEMKNLESNWRENENIILCDWLKNKENYIPSNNNPNNYDAQKYVEEAELQTICLLNPEFVKKTIAEKEDINFNNFPALKVILFSQYYRLYDPYWKQSPSEVTDIFIMTAAPYVDVVITEKFQLNIFDKIENLIEGFSNIEIYRLSMIRSVE